MERTRSERSMSKTSSHTVDKPNSASITRMPTSSPVELENMPATRKKCNEDYPRPHDSEKGLTGPEPRCSGSRPVWQPWKREDKWAGWGSDNVATMAMVPSLVVQAFATGILDATTYADFHTFASNQTGNTILLTVSVLGHVEVLRLLTGLSLAAFLFGALMFGHLGHYMGVRKRYWIITSTIYQIVLLAISAILVSPSGPRVTQIGAKHEWLTLVIFANMSGAQVAMARQSGSQELPTAPMTSSYVDLMADKYLFVGFRHPKAGPRNRRLSYILAMISGGFLGAVVHRYAGSWAVIVITVAFKVLALGMICVASADDR